MKLLLLALHVIKAFKSARDKFKNNSSFIVDELSLETESVSSSNEPFLYHLTRDGGFPIPTNTETRIIYSLIIIS